MKRKQITELLIHIVSAELVGAFAGLISKHSFSFYQDLAKPPFSPPGWVFPVIWVILYALMGLSVFLIETSGAEHREKKKAFWIYGVQLFVNFLWSVVFFRLRLIPLSVAVILLLLLLVITMIIAFWKIRPAAAYINVPYLLWTAFAVYLNIGVFLFN